MLDPKKDWLPIGSVVRLEGGERLVMIAGYLAVSDAKDQVWDYLGYLHPEGNQHDDAIFFQRELIDEVFQLGFIDADALRMMDLLTAAEADQPEQAALTDDDAEE